MISCMSTHCIYLYIKIYFIGMFINNLNFDKIILRTELEKIPKIKLNTFYSTQKWIRPSLVSSDQIEIFFKRLSCFNLENN